MTTTSYKPLLPLRIADRREAVHDRSGLVAQRQPVNALRQHLGEGMRDQQRRTTIAKTACQPPQQVDPPVCLPQQQRPNVRPVFLPFPPESFPNGINLGGKSARVPASCHYSSWWSPSSLSARRLSASLNTVPQLKAPAQFGSKIPPPEVVP